MLSLMNRAGNRLSMIKRRPSSPAGAQQLKAHEFISCYGTVLAKETIKKPLPHEWHVLIILRSLGRGNILFCPDETAYFTELAGSPYAVHFVPFLKKHNMIAQWDGDSESPYWVLTRRGFEVWVTLETWWKHASASNKLRARLIG